MDDPNQMRVRMEAEAIELFFLHLLGGKVAWIASTILEAEIRRNPDVQSREDALSMLPFASEFHSASVKVADRARFLNTLGYGEFDALHLAIAEDYKADLLLTTDDRFLRLAERGVGSPFIRVINPHKICAGGEAMIALQEMTDEQFERHTLGLLQKELGPYGMARFLRTYRSGTDDYTRDRHKWLDGATMDDILKDIENLALQKPTQAQQP
jgi:predicted nucleic acid-binding protein